LLLLSLLTLTWSQQARAAFILNTSDGQFTPGVDNQGWWSSTSFNYDGDDNHNVGSYNFANGDNLVLRNFFTFDLRSIDLGGHSIVSALLQVRRGLGEGDATETVTFHQVTTDAATLNFNDGISSSIFDDLGGGTAYGTFTLTTSSANFDEVISLPLNAAAITAITTAAGNDFFSIGGSLDSISGSFYQEFLFLYTYGSGSVQRLLITLDSDPISMATSSPTALIIVRWSPIWTKLTATVMAWAMRATSARPPLTPARKTTTRMALATPANRRPTITSPVPRR
jgi:hypothetical protein